MIDRCSHCGDYMVISCCPCCAGTIKNICRECHNELVHNQFTQQNVHICGSPHGTVDDEDAYRVSTQNECYGLPII